MPLPDPRYYHKLFAADLFGLTHALDVQSDARVNFGFMTPLGAYSGQLWRFAPEDGGYRLSTVFGGPDLCAAVTEGEEAEVHLSDAGETWTLERLPGPAPLARSFYARLCPRRRPGTCLDLAAGVGFVIPVVAARSDAPGQRWLVARTDGEVG